MTQLTEGEAMANRTLYTLFPVLFLTGAHGVGCQEQANLVAKGLPAQRVVSITDVDSDGRTETLRAEMKFDRDGRRLTNKVFDRTEQLIGTERFQYDAQGKLTARQYLSPDAKLKWRWQRFQYDDAGKPIRNDIVNKKGKKIGWYVWQYDDRGRLSRRDRFNADGTLKFYYGDIRFDENGNFLTWTRYDDRGAKVGLKKWEYAAR